MFDTARIRRAAWRVGSHTGAWPIVGLGRAFSNRAGRKRILILSETDAICQSQIFPFHFYLPEFQRAGQYELREVPTARFEARPERAPAAADIVLVQTWYDLTREHCDELFAKIRRWHPSAKIVVLDPSAPTDLRLAEMLNRHVDLYVKKHVLRDRSRYGQATLGDTTLEDFYGSHFGIERPPTTFVVPPGFLNKLVVGPSFFTSSKMLPHFHAVPFRQAAAPTIDVHARLAFKGSSWYSAMRQLAVDRVEALARTDGLRVESRIGVKPRVYMAELRSSRLCFSPFGYGEVCWRDYEAVMCGAVLIKPDMSHVETEPDIFRPWQTYAPVAWDFSDLPDVAARTLRDADNSRRMAARAYECLSGYAKSGRFVQQMARVFA